MSMRRDSMAAIFLLIVFAAYGQQALQIEMFPGQELEPFKPRTMPVVLAAAGILLCIIHILQTLRDSSVEVAVWGRLRLETGRYLVRRHARLRIRHSPRLVLLRPRRSSCLPGS